MTGALRAPDRSTPIAPSAYPAVVSALAGLAMVIGSWIAVAHEPAFTRQVGYLNVAVGGVLVVAGGAAVYLVEYRRQIRRRVLAITAGEGRS